MQFSLSVHADPLQYWKMYIQDLWLKSAGKISFFHLYESLLYICQVCVKTLHICMPTAQPYRFVHYKSTDKNVHMKNVEEAQTHCCQLVY